MNNLSETLLLLADDIEQRPDDECWYRIRGGNYTPMEALDYIGRSTYKDSKW